MSTSAEDALYAALTNIEDLERLARLGLPLEAIPTEEMRQVVDWAIHSYYQSGRRQAPTRGMLIDTWGQHIEDSGIELLDENQEYDSIDEVVEHLRGLYVDREWQVFIRAAAQEMATSPLNNKAETLNNLTAALFGLTNDLTATENRVEAQHGLADSWKRYEDRKAMDHAVTGLTFGWDKIDTHTGGIRDGELAVLGAGPKVGKSYLLDKVALHEWQQGRRTVLFTLENSVEMTYDRIACLAARVSARAYQRGELTTAQEERVQEILKGLHDRKTQLHVISPQRSQRTPASLVHEALNLGAQSILVDQLTHVEHPSPGRKPRHELFSENIHEFKYLISTGREQVPLLLAHQINRDGVKASNNVGYLEMTHMAESSGVERAADWVFGLYQGKMDRTARRAVFQILASRREDIDAWEMGWDIEASMTEVRGRYLVGAQPSE